MSSKNKTILYILIDKDEKCLNDYEHAHIVGCVDSSIVHL